MYKRYIKRLLDILIALLVLIVLLPMLLLTAILQVRMLEEIWVAF